MAVIIYIGDKETEFCTWRNEREFSQTNFAVQDCFAVDGATGRHRLLHVSRNT